MVSGTEVQSGNEVTFEEDALVDVIKATLRSAGQKQRFEVHLSDLD
jgi:hypothetical protein